MSQRLGEFHGQGPLSARQNFRQVPPGPSGMFGNGYNQSIRPIEFDNHQGGMVDRLLPNEIRISGQGNFGGQVKMILSIMESGF